MNKILVGATLVIIIAISAILYFDSDDEVEDMSLSKTEVTAKVNESKNDVADDVGIKDKANVLNLSGQNLTKAPENIFGQVMLEELNLSNNKLEGSLQAEVRFLENLRVLDLSNNNFTGLPAEVGQLTKLEILNLANNKLTGLPLELGNLKSIQRIDLRGNDYSRQDLDSIRAKLPSSVAILVD